MIKVNQKFSVILGFVSSKFDIFSWTEVIVPIFIFFLPFFCNELGCCTFHFSRNSVTSPNLGRLSDAALCFFWKSGEVLVPEEYYGEAVPCLLSCTFTIFFS